MTVRNSYDIFILHGKIYYPMLMISIYPLDIPWRQATNVFDLYAKVLWFEKVRLG